MFRILTNRPSRSSDLQDVPSKLRGQESVTAITLLTFCLFDGLQAFVFSLFEDLSPTWRTGSNFSSSQTKIVSQSATVASYNVHPDSNERKGGNGKWDIREGERERGVKYSK